MRLHRARRHDAPALGRLHVKVDGRLVPGIEVARQPSAGVKRREREARSHRQAATGPQLVVDGDRLRLPRFDRHLDPELVLLLRETAVHSTHPQRPSVERDDRPRGDRPETDRHGRGTIGDPERSVVVEHVDVCDQAALSALRSARHAGARDTEQRQGRSDQDWASFSKALRVGLLVFNRRRPRMISSRCIRNCFAGTMRSP